MLQLVTIGLQILAFDVNFAFFSFAQKIKASKAAACTIFVNFLLAKLYGTNASKTL